MTRKGKALTPKQRHFCRAVASGSTLTDAYIEAYSTSNMNHASIGREATRLGSDPRITTHIETLNKTLDTAVIATRLSDRELVLNTLRDIIANAEGTPAENTLLRACDLLGKSIGLYKDVVVETAPQRSPEEIREDIKRLLDEIEAESGSKHRSAVAQSVARSGHSSRPVFAVIRQNH